MKTFQYTALDQNGQETTGSIEAVSEEDAIKRLRGQSLYPTEVCLPGQSRRAASAIKAKAKVSLMPNVISRRSGYNFYIRKIHRFSLRGILAWLCSPFTRRRDTARERRLLWSLLGTLTRCGTPILMSLKLCSRSASFRENCELMLAVHDSVKEGESIVGPLEARGISPIEVALIGVGEETGQLPETLKVIGELPDECRLDKDIQLGLVSFLAPLLDAGLPLVRALDVMERGYRQSGGTALAQVARDLVEQIRTGSTFSEALARHPEFDSVALSLVKAGELGGVLEITLAQLRDWMLEDYRRLGYAA